MTTTPQAALLTPEESIDMARVFSNTNEYEHGLVVSMTFNRSHLLEFVGAIEQAVIAKLQATQEPVQAGELPPLPVPTKAGHLVSSCPVYQDLEVKRIQKAAFDAGAALSARKPLTDEKIVQSMRDAGWPDVLVRHVVGAREFTASLASRIGLEVKHG